MGKKSQNRTYYAEKLSASRLKKCYDLATPRISQYLYEEIKFVLELIPENNHVLELGCGYGRIFASLLHKTHNITGIDNSFDNLIYGKSLYMEEPNIHWIHMDVSNIEFNDNSFDIVLCIQNGISAFKVDPETLFHESIRISKPGGRAIFSTYATSFWEHRLEWFKIQSAHGLIGEIDYKNTKMGKIVCEDGFSSRTFSPQEFKTIIKKMDNVIYKIAEVDSSSLFCVLTKK